MSFLGNEDTTAKKSSTWLVLLVFLGVAIAYFGLKTTLSANININSGSPVEFGQGLAQITSCSGSQSIIITPQSSFTNSGGRTGSFKFSSFKVSNIPSGCYGFDFSLSAFDSTTGSTALALFNSSSTNATIYDNNGTFQVGTGGTGLTVATVSSTSFTATFDTPVSVSGSVYKITIQSSQHTPIPCAATNGECVLGDTGPGGGKIFYVNAGGFTCGPTLNLTCHYLEAAPNTWYGGSSDPVFIWADPGSDSTLIGATAQRIDIGSGYANTLAIVNQPNGTSTSAGAVRNYNGGGKNDWYLGNVNEMTWLGTNQAYVSPIVQNYYATSEESDATHRRIYGMVDHANWYGHSKNTNNISYTRPIRAF
jgi:hypothetical protein